MMVPADIENKHFKSSFMGYSKTDVEDFLVVLLKDYEKLCKDNELMKSKIEQLRESLEKYQSMEDSIKNAMMIAQKMSDDIRQSATGKAELIIKDASIKANQLILDAQNDIRSVENKKMELETEINNCKVKVKAILIAQLNLLSEIPIAGNNHKKNDLNMPKQDSRPDLEKKDEKQNK